MANGQKFSNIPEDTVTSLTTADKWKDDAFNNMVSYNVTKQSSSDLLRTFNSLIKDMKEKEAKRTSHLKAMVLATHLGKPSSKAWTMMKELESMTGGEEPDLEIPPVPTATEPQYEDETVGADDAEKAAKKKRNDDKRAAYRRTIRDPFKPDSGSDNTEKLMTYSEANIKYATFIGSLLMKMISKDASNVAQSWNTAKARFKGFYLEEIGYEFSAPSLEWLNSMKVFLNHDKRAVKTILKFTVACETTYTDPDSNEAGITRYLFSLPFSYTGMHAYKLFLAVKTASGKKNEYLMNALVHPKTYAALKDIETILRDFESRVGKVKSPRFRYARIVGPQFFMGLQTKNCPALVYCLVKILNEYSGGTEESQFRPDNIVGIQNLSQSVKTEMSMAAKLIAGTVTEEEANDYSAVMLKARADVAAEKNKKKTVPTTRKDPFASS
uniref:Nucleoprotein n=1 Tax=Cytorhabdovirus sp. TaxID=2714181 RepID=A0A6M3GZT3_9RHAB|nr:nucleocapsid protein [Cytorhabdovirus sp.]